MFVNVHVDVYVQSRRVCCAVFPMEECDASVSVS